jgi:hypothetical protein
VIRKLELSAGIGIPAVAAVLAISQTAYLIGLMRASQNPSARTLTLRLDSIAPMKGAPNIAAELSVQERVLLFCLASGTEWAQAGVTGATATMMLVRSLVERDALARLQMTPQGREVFKVRPMAGSYRLRCPSRCVPLWISPSTFPLTTAHG